MGIIRLVSAAGAEIAVFSPGTGARIPGMDRQIYPNFTAGSAGSSRAETARRAGNRR